MKWFSKGQIGMIEMIMVMVVVMVLLVIGIVFYFKFSVAHTEKIGEKISEEKASVIVSTVVQLPEIECTYLGSRTSKACADVLKLLALSIKDKKQDEPGYVEHRRHYSNLFGYMTIKFEQLWPLTTGEECTNEIFQLTNYPEIPPDELSCGSWTIYNNPKQGAITEETPFRSMPIALYYPMQDMYALGQLKIYIY